MKHLENILFIDIETASVVPDYSFLTNGMQQQWNRKAKMLTSRNQEEKEAATFFDEKAGIFSEFGRVVCIGLGCYVKEGNFWKFMMKSFSGEDEKILLIQFTEALQRFSSLQKTMRFCGHNIKEFDIPFLCRRMVINGIELPKSMQLSGAKPWDIPHLDTLELWRFGDYKHYITLELLSEVLGIPSPKDDIDGSRVSDIFWKEKDLQRISTYCLKDVYTTASIYLKLKGIPDINAQPEYL
ncbi:MAG TPA: ribonuclease H-like domain-containing protein [Flavipsychrobacter sp.]|nr:ribonuclease H-like domain-containing protein [Flavipsychrobacter sp.]